MNAEYTCHDWPARVVLRFMPQGRIICNDPCHGYHRRDHQVAQPNPGDIIKRCHSQQTDKNDEVKCPVNDKPDNTGNHGLAGVCGRDCSKKNRTMRIAAVMVATMIMIDLKRTGSIRRVPFLL